MTPSEDTSDKKEEEEWIEIKLPSSPPTENNEEDNEEIKSEEE